MGRERPGPTSEATPLVNLALLFLKLGTVAFGGPAAHIAMMEDEVVRRRQWLTHEEFLDLLGATNLIPGPNSTEMAIHIGHRRHYTPRALEQLAGEAGYQAVSVDGAGFPFFNLYKLVVVLRGDSLVQDLDQQKGVSRASLAAMSVFDRVFRFNQDRTARGWQIFGVFTAS